MPDKSEAMEKVKSAEKNVEKTVERLEKSKFAQKIPTEVKNLSVKDLMFLTYIVKISYFLPAYLIVSIAKEPSLNIGRWVIQMFKTIYIIVALVDLVFEGVIAIGSIKSFHGLACISALIKNVVVNTVLISYVAVEKRTMVFLAYAVFAAIMIGIDIFFLYYMSVSFKNTDDEGKDNADDKV